MGQKTVKFNEEEIANLPDNRPVLYKISTSNNNNYYTGVAQRGHVRERVMEHLGEIPGAKVRIEQMKSIEEAREKEGSVISRSTPKYNNQK